MNRVLTALVLLVTTWGFKANAGGGEAGCESGVHFFQDYIGQLADIDSNTAKYFNLRYLSQEMKKRGMPNEEVATRLLKYTSSIDQLLEGIALMAVNVSCADKSSRLIFQVDDEDSIGKGDYMIVRLVEGKIINVSFEKSGVLLDDTEIQRLAYKDL